MNTAVFLLSGPTVLVLAILSVYIINKTSFIVESRQYASFWRPKFCTNEHDWPDEWRSRRSANDEWGWQDCLDCGTRRFREL